MLPNNKIIRHTHKQVSVPGHSRQHKLPVRADVGRINRRDITNTLNLPKEVKAAMTTTGKPGAVVQIVVLALEKLRQHYIGQTGLYSEHQVNTRAM